MVLFAGEAVEEGSTEGVFQRGRHPYTRALLAAVPRMGSMAGRNLPQRFPLIDVRTGEQQIQVDVTDTVAKAKAPVLEVRDLTTSFDVRTGLFGGKTGAVHAVEKISFDLFEG